MGEPSVVIVGAGFAGLYAARALDGAPVKITLVDRKNHHTFQPLLYQVATAGLNPSEIAIPIRRVFRKQKNCEVLLAEAKGIDLEAKKLLLDIGELAYDTLIIATGATHSYFGHQDWEAYAPGLKSIEDALDIRRRIYFAYEAAERSSTEEERTPWLTFLVVGAGPTGVELAGMLAEIARHALSGEFRRIDTSKARVLLVEGGPRVLAAYDAALSEKAKEQLKDLGVEVLTDARVTSIDGDGVTMQRGDKSERVEAKTVLWAAGVAASPLGKMLGAPLDRAGRVLVEPDLSLPGHPEVFVVGDVAAIKDGEKWVPGVAPAAMQGAKHTAKNILRGLRGEPRLPFKYADKGSLATIGRARAIADFGRFKLSGFFAWLSWLFIHVMFLIGFRNRFLVVMEWALSYLTYSRNARLITGDLAKLSRFDRVVASVRGGAKETVKDASKESESA